MREDRFIEKSYKTSFIVRFCLLVILTALISGFVLYLLWYRELGATYTQAISTLVSLKKVIIPIIVITILIQVVFISAVTIFLTLFVSHKIAGPIYRLEKSLEAIGGGDLTLVDIHLRSSDQIQSLARSFGDMCRSIQQRIIMVKDSFQRIKENKERIDRMVKGASREDLGSVFKDMSQKTEELKDRLKELKTV